MNVSNPSGPTLMSYIQKIVRSTMLNKLSLVQKMRGILGSFAAIICATFLFSLAYAQSSSGLPPRTVEDILAVLDQYNPDSTIAEKTRAIVTQSPPTTSDDVVLGKFYLGKL